VNVYHITTRKAWIAATRDGIYDAPSLASAGFIHCSTSAQVLPVARQFYAGQSGLVLLAIDPSRLALTSVLKWEPAADGPVPVGIPGSQRFPHVYGPINLEAVVRVLDFEPDANGEFRALGLLTHEADLDSE
jgi:uncharacterized protein (DUF952 family)